MAIYMKYGALDGEVTAVGYEKWVQCHSFQFGVGRGIAAPGTGGGSKREATAPSVSEMTVTTTTDSFSPLILKEALGGKATEVKIELTQTDAAGKQIAFQKYVLTNTLVSGLSTSTGGDRPSESLSLNFTKFESLYIAIDDKFVGKPKGAITYDMAESKLV